MKMPKCDKKDVNFVRKENDLKKQPKDTAEERLNLTESYQVLKESVAELRL